MPLPKSFTDLGYQTPEKIVGRLKVMIGTEGEANTGKSEFMMSAPGPILFLCLDRNVNGMLMNSEPPKSRRDDVGMKMITTPGSGQALLDEFKGHWVEFYNEYLKALSNSDARTVGLDGDSDSWELQRLATFGKLTQVPSIMYDDINAARRGMIRRAYDSGKIIISTNKVTDVYADKKDASGAVEYNRQGKAIQVKSGEFRRQGFGDHKYLWDIQLQHLYKPATYNKYLDKMMPQKWGVKFLECKPRMELKGEELWGQDCNFKGVVTLAYPAIDPERWFK